MGSKKKGNKIPAKFTPPLHIVPNSITRPSSNVEKHIMVFGEVKSRNRGLIDIKVFSPNGNVTKYLIMFVPNSGTGGAGRGSYGFPHPVRKDTPLGNYGITLTIRDPGWDSISGNFDVIMPLRSKK